MTPHLLGMEHSVIQRQQIGLCLEREDLKTVEHCAVSPIISTDNALLLFAMHILW